MRIIICDDDRRYADITAKTIRNAYTAWKVVCTTSSEELMQCLEAGKADAVFMDIELGSENGIAAAEKVTRKYPDMKIIFITSYSQKYCEAIFLQNAQLKPFGYIDKSSDFSVLLKTLNNLRETVEGGNSEECSDSFLFIKTREGKKKLPLRDILYIESIVRIAKFVMAGGYSYECYGKMKELAETLPKNFMLCHKSYIINIERISGFKSNLVWFENGDEVPVSRTYSREIKEAIVLNRSEKF